ncbi:MAG TPA: glucose-6-phosphate dehydrogenase assembly protein OpcA [Ktedonosporobacter sp.]|nr:glucose-6-phosphate dehydrogenase assembly protein OpcA [Ktedonosporobacter sp.]
MVKDNANTTGPRVPWAGKLVGIESVEEELSRFWRMAADNVRTSQNINVRTSVLNFVICAPDLASAQYTSGLIRELSSTHIARVILLILDRTDPTTHVSTWVTLRSFPIISDMMRHHFEQITILASGAAIDASAQIIQPLLKPDLPVYLWWLHDLPADNVGFKRLLTISSRVILDSSSFFTPEESMCSLPELVQTVPNTALSDLSWGRITPWRELIAQFFDVAEYKPYLVGVDHIEIEHAVAPFDEPSRTDGQVSPNSTQALLLGAWLKTRLGWSLAPDSQQDEHDPDRGIHAWYMLRPRTTGSLTRTTGPLTAQTGSLGTGKTGKLGTLLKGPVGKLHIRPRLQPSLRPGSICLVRLTSAISGKQATFTINREDDSDHVLTSVELAERTRPQRTVSMAATHKESELLHDELEIMGRDHLYEETLQEVFDLLTES